MFWNMLVAFDVPSSADSNRSALLEQTEGMRQNLKLAMNVKFQREYSFLLDETINFLVSFRLIYNKNCFFCAIFK
jgi:hypothetical protein